MDKRIGWLEVTRFIAILMVLIIHNVDEGVYKSGLENDTQWYASQFFHLIGRLGVPLFFMITGSLLIPRLKDVKIMSFYLKRIPQFCILIIFYTLLINASHSLINNQPFNFSSTMNKLSHGDTGSAYQLWFLYSITAMYLAMPFLSKMLNVMSNNEILIFIILSVLFFYLPTSSDTLFSYRLFSAPLNVDPVNGFVSYVVTGYFISHRMNLKLNETILFLSVIIMLSLSLYTQGYLKNLNKMNGDGIGWYSSIFIFACSIPAFFILNKYGDSIFNVAPKTFTLLSKSSFCVFLLHLIPTWIILQYLVDLKINLALAISISIIGSYLFCIAFYLAFYKVPVLKKLVS
ncbi:acyltransferase family protein [Pantoea agglomerans]|uniref:acyltransferase n=1 Tax=Enterobacter agglomerans TaxID=549 RepID=UPI003C7D7867